MNAQARVGIFTLLAIVGIFAAYYFITSYALRHAGYQIGVHFHDVGGLQEGSSVLLSGVQIGEVTGVKLLPDQTVDVICAIEPDHEIYRDSTFWVAITITGQTSLTIKPPPPQQRAFAAVLPHEVLPEREQPWGTLPPSLQDLISVGQVQLQNFSKTMAVVNRELPLLARRFDAIAGHTDALVLHTDTNLRILSGELNAVIANLNDTIATSGRNLSSLTGNINGVLTENRAKLNALVANLATTSDNLNKTMAGVASIAQDPMFHDSLVGTAQNVRDATAKLKAIATDIQSITGDPKTQSQLRGAITNLSAATAKANDILGAFSSAQATEVPATSPSTSPQPSGAAPTARPVLRRSLSQPLAAAQVRETWSDRGGGPASDLNIVLLPGLRTHLTVGANDLGYSTSYNFLLTKNATPALTVSGGVLYSKLGLAALFRPFGGPVGVDARLYDPKHPTLDLYGDLRLAQRLQLFYGERSIWGTATKTPSFGIQLNY